MRRLPLYCLHPGCKEIVVFRDGGDIDDLSQPVQIQVEALKCQKKLDLNLNIYSDGKDIFRQLLERFWLWFGPTFNHNYNFCFSFTNNYTLVVEEWIFDFNDLPFPLVSIEWRKKTL